MQPAERAEEPARRRWNALRRIMGKGALVVLFLLSATSLREEGASGPTASADQRIDDSRSASPVASVASNDRRGRASNRDPVSDRDPAAIFPETTKLRGPETPKVRAARERIGELVNEAIGLRKLPGCVVVVGRRDAILIREAYGLRQIDPTPVTMTENTVFDLASLTKPIATATSVMVLAERGSVRIDDAVAQYVPAFAAANDKAGITLRDLLVHVSGLPADTAFDDYEHGLAAALQRFSELPLRGAPRTRFIYSDIGYLVLQAVVERVSGKSLDRFVHDEITEPLGMQETTFSPSGELLARAAPTEQRDGEWIRGVVHDPRAFRLGGVAGHAGLFSTADDLARYARAILGGGELLGRRILSDRSVRSMIAPQDVPGGIRALGWDISSRFSANRGKTLSRGAVGHGGYTGTSIWIDPAKDLFVIFLSNRVHPDGKGSVNALVAQIGAIAGDLPRGTDRAENSESTASARHADETMPAQTLGSRANHAVVAFGVDVLENSDFAQLRGARIGLISNGAARDAHGQRTIDVLHRAPNVNLVALFAPEHGLGANRDEKIADAVDETTGLTVHSLYGKAQAPTETMLAGIDTLVFDLQDAGARFFTYASTLHAALKVAAERGLGFVVLDRPNPIGGEDASGPVLRASGSTFVNHYPLPVRHGMTLGELAEMLNADEHLAARLEVVRMKGWNRASYYDQTGHAWEPPSPNLRSIDAAILYPGVALIEGTNVSVGRGTETPFQLIGAPWINGRALASALGGFGLVGVTVEPTVFRPVTTVHAGLACGGVSLRLRDRSQVDPVRLGIAIAVALRRLYPSAWDTHRLGDMIGSAEVTSGILAGRNPVDIEASWGPDLEAFRSKRLKYLLYPDQTPGDPPGR